MANAINKIDPIELIEMLSRRIAQQNQQILRQKEQLADINRIASTALVSNVPEWHRHMLCYIQQKSSS
jgi:hypothetical protein